MKQLCQWCGNSRHGGYNKSFGKVEEEVMSPSWRKAYEKYGAMRPNLSSYGLSNSEPEPEGPMAADGESR